MEIIPKERKRGSAVGSGSVCLEASACLWTINSCYEVSVPWYHSQTKKPQEKKTASQFLCQCVLATVPKYLDKYSTGCFCAGFYFLFFEMTISIGGVWVN